MKLFSSPTEQPHSRARAQPRVWVCNQNTQQAQQGRSESFFLQMLLLQIKSAREKFSELLLFLPNLYEREFPCSTQRCGEVPPRTNSSRQKPAAGGAGWFPARQRSVAPLLWRGRGRRDRDRQLCGFSLNAQTPSGRWRSRLALPAVLSPR